jgi:hypothetical protein
LIVSRVDKITYERIIARTIWRSLKFLSIRMSRIYSFIEYCRLMEHKGGAFCRKTNNELWIRWRRQQCINASKALVALHHFSFSAPKTIKKENETMAAQHV